MGNFLARKKTNKQVKKIMERRIKNNRPKGEITTYASYGLIFYGQDEVGTLWLKWGTKPWVEIKEAKNKQD